jgi:hypothetical protein
MKVYCVFTSNDYEYGEIRAIFDSLEKAEKYMAESKKPCNWGSPVPDYSIEEWEVE